MESNSCKHNKNDNCYPKKKKKERKSNYKIKIGQCNISQNIQLKLNIAGAVTINKN